MQLEGLKLEPGMTIELPPAPYYVCTFGSNFSPSTNSGNVYAYMTGTSALNYDIDGNLYATGLGYTSDIGNQGLTVKFNTKYNVDWQKRLSTGSTNDNTVFYSSSLDNSNNLYVCGISTKNAQAQYKYPTFQIAKYNATGGLVWQRNLGTSATNSTPNFGQGIIVEKSTDNIYVVGDIVSGSPVSYQFSDMTIIKYNSLGVIQWAKQIGTSGTNDHCNAVALDSTGNVYMAGSTTYGGQNAAALVKYNNAGILQWQVCLSGTASGNLNQFNGIVIDSSNNIYVCGQAWNPSVSVQVGVVAKYNSSGTLLWQRQLYSSSNSNTFGGLALDSSENVYAVGSGRVYSGVIVKYNSAGVLQWQRRVTGSYSSGIVGVYLSSIKFDSSGAMCSGGYVYANGVNQNMLIIKLPSDGTLTGTYLVNGIEITYEVGNHTEAALSFTPATSTMTSLTINYIGAGASSLSNIPGSFINHVTPIT
jgi:hypothetical protein